MKSSWHGAKQPRGETPNPAGRSAVAIRNDLGEKEKAAMVKSIEVSVRGKWTKVPAFDFDNQTILVMGDYVKVASVHQEDWSDTQLKDVEGCIHELRQRREQGLRVDVFTFAQKLPEVTPRYLYHTEADSLAAIRISSFQGWWESLPQETRKNVRRSQKRGVEIRLETFSDDLVRAITSVNNERAVRQGRRFPHYGKTFDQVKKDYSSFLDRSDFICAYHENELIGILKLIYRGDIGSVLQLLVKLSHQDKRPANALLCKAVELCAAKGLLYLIYGKFTYGNKGNSSLSEFKARHGFEEVLMPRYYVPLSVFGALYTRMRLYRGLIGILPSGLIAVGLKARLAWYSLSRGRATQL